MAKRFQKILISAIIFALVFVSCGLPVKSIASEGKKLFSFSFFHKDEIALNAYFDDDLENVEKNLNVNDTARLTVEINPLIEGYFEEGRLELNLKNGNENNFKIKSVTTFKQEEEKTELFNSVMKLDTTEEMNTEKKDVETDNFNESKKESVVKVENEVASNLGSSLFDTTKNIFLDSSIVSDNQDSKATQAEEKDTSNTVNEEKAVENEDAKVEESKEEKKDEVINQEDSNIEEFLKVEESYEVEQKDENKVQLKNIIEDTKIFIDLEYKENEELNIEDLYSEIMVTLEGNYINEDLESIEIFQEREINLGWEYTKDVEVSAEYTKVSPFTVGDNFGTIVESEIKVKRSVDSKSLPIKETSVKIEIQKINDKLPQEINVSASKMMATLGKESVSSKAMENYCSYDKENGVLEIKVSNTKLVLGNGEDILNISCRYEDYFEDEQITLNKNIQIQVEEYSSKENIIQEKKINEKQEIEVKSGELISYFVSETEEKINKGKINANYYLENKYETEFSNVINLNILTSDVLDEILLQPSTDVYVDGEGNVYEANEEVKYKGVKFKTVEIQEMLEKGSTIDLLDGNGKVFHTISSENSATSITFSENIDTLQVRINEIHTNGIIKVEFVKAIETSKYEPQLFKDITKISSTIDVNVKYAGFEERFSLPKVTIDRNFSESYTKAEISMDREYLSATKDNENVELKIVLNNDTNESDLYTNPIFEIVFPSYIKDVNINNVYMLYKNGLSIKEYKVFKEDGVCKAQVILEGRQEGFDFSNITNGTNIILNANIIINDVTPQKEDEIILYYYNETASHYQTQTTVSDNVLGYDSTIFEYQTPIGLIAINSISNFNEENQIINSIEQGEILEIIDREQSSKVATMELTVVNNTQEECIETIFFGRVPFKGNTDVETGKDLGTNIDTVMKTGLIANETNTKSVTIYYSSNPNATKDLNNEENRWTQTVTNIEEIKSYLIVVNDTIEPNDILKFRYDFEIPENLGYDAKILGSFGAFYNRKSDSLIMYDSSIADSVGLITEVGAKVEAKLEANVENNIEVRECEFITYKVTVKNTGSLLAENITVTCPVPEYSQLYLYTNNNGFGNNNFISSNNKTKEFKIDKLDAGEEKILEYVVKTEQIPDVITYYSTQTGKKIEKDNTGYYYEEITNKGTEEEKKEKVYVENVPQLFIKNKVNVKIANVAEEIKTNEIKNPLVDSNFDIEVNTEWPSPLNIGETFLYMSTIKNISGAIQNNVLVECKLPDTVKYIEPEVYVYGKTDKTYDYNDVFYNEENHTVEFIFDSMEPEEMVNAYVRAEVVKGENKAIDNYYLVTSEDKKETKSSIMTRTYTGPKLEIRQESNLKDTEILEGEKVEFRIIIENKGNAGTKNIKIYDEISKNLLNFEASIIGDVEEKARIKDGKVDTTILSLQGGKSLELIISGIAANVEENEVKQISNRASVSDTYCGDMETEEITIDIKNNPDLVDKENLEDSSDESRAEENGSQDGVENEDENINSDSNENNQEESKQDENKDKQDETQNNNESENKNESDKPSSNNQQNNSQQNNNQQNNNVNNEQSNQNINEEKEQEENVDSSKTYMIQGSIWLDENGNGRKDESEKCISGVKVQLLENGNELKTLTTNNSGMYKFSGLEKGNYSLVYVYDENIYKLTSYSATNVEEDLQSKAIKNTDGKAVSNNIEIVDKDVVNYNVGFVENNKFDLEIEKYVTKAIVKTGEKETTYNFDNQKLGKIEIKAKKINDSQVTLEYKIVVTNTGDFSGKALSIVDYIPEGMEFNKDKNTDWHLGADGKVYNESLKNIDIKPGESKELKLVLTKKMTEDNTGVISNKASIVKTECSLAVEDNQENNTNTQKMIITISTGAVQKSIAFIFIIAILFAVRSKFIISNKKVKKIYR